MKRKRRIPPLVLTAGFWALILCAAALGLSAVRSMDESRQLTLVKNAVRRGAVQCYALEGVYPPDLETLISASGLVIDPARCIIHYGYRGSNLLPDIRVFAAPK